MPDQVPANFLDGAGVGVGAARDGVAVRSLFGSITRFAFGFADGSGAGVGFSSKIGAGSCWALRKSNRLPTRMLVLLFI